MPETKLETRQRIINAAMDLFVYNSYTRTGLAEIARKADALPGSLYHYFPTKEHLLAAVLEERKKLLWPEVLDPIWSRIDDPIERIFGLMDAYRQMLVMTEFSHGCPIGNLALELCDSHPNSRRLIAENFDNWLSAVEQCFIDAKDRLPDATDPRQLAIFTLTTMEGAVMLARTYRDLRAYDTAISVLRDYIDRLINAETNWNQPHDPGHREGADMAAPVIHFEIGCKNAGKTVTFYSELLGWTTQTYGPAQMIDTGSKEGITGHIQAPGHEPHNYVVLYAQVDQLEPYIEKAKKLGGKLMIPPQEVPGMGHFAWITDPEGTIFGLWKAMKA